MRQGDSWELTFCYCLQGQLGLQIATVFATVLIVAFARSVVVFVAFVVLVDVAFVAAVSLPSNIVVFILLHATRCRKHLKLMFPSWERVWGPFHVGIAFKRGVVSSCLNQS